MILSLLRYGILFTHSATPIMAVKPVLFVYYTFLYPVHQMSDTFKGKFLDSLKRVLRKQNELSLFNDRVQAAYKSRWVVNCEPSMAGAEHVVKYLGQYTHRVGLFFPYKTLIPNHQYFLRSRGKRERYVLSWTKLDQKRTF